MTDAEGGAEADLLRLAVELGADRVGGSFSREECRLLEVARGRGPRPPGQVVDARAAILRGEDPLGDAFCALRDSRQRRRAGAFYTPASVVAPMLEWALSHAPSRLVDPGCGSGRFAAAAARTRPGLRVIAVDLDPVATLLTRAALAVIDAREPQVLHTDYTKLSLPPEPGPTAFVGNPPYVRHHDLTASAKQWASRAAERLGLRASGLAGLHAHFYLATAALAHRGDLGCFVTSAEWLDVNYGQLVRGLLAGALGGQSLHVISTAESARVFEDAMTTAAIACFQVGAETPQLHFRRVASAAALDNLDARGGQQVERNAAAQARRWSPLLDPRRPRARRPGTVALREIARVHRGVATGANRFFVLAREEAEARGVSAWCRPVITGARQILDARGEVRNGPDLRLLLTVPGDVDRAGHPALDAYLRTGEPQTGARGAVSERYLPSHRKPWWHLGSPVPPPIVASYMARQPPRFAINPDSLLILNIAHGLYPSLPMSDDQLRALVEELNRSRRSYAGKGRTYAGGLEKFEPREMELLSIPAQGPWT